MTYKYLHFITRALWVGNKKIKRRLLIFASIGKFSWNVFDWMCFFQFRALYGKSICNYQLVLLTDPKLQNSKSVAKCLKILAFLRLITQVVLPKEPLCWLVYNGNHLLCFHTVDMIFARFTFDTKKYVTHDIIRANLKQLFFPIVLLLSCFVWKMC